VIAEQEIDDTDGSLNLFSLFSFYWAGAILLHYAGFPTFSPLGLIFYVPFVLTLLWPGNVYFFLIGCFVQVIDFTIWGTWVANHWVVTTAANGAILTSALYLIIQNRSLLIDRQQLFLLFRPLLCLIVLLTYLSAILHKLNYGYFNIETGASVRLYLSYTRASHLFFSSWLPTTPAILWLAVFASLFIEAFVPILLLVGRTRMLGVLLGVLFHFMLSLRSVIPELYFPSLLVALYIVFFPLEFARVLNPLASKIMQTIAYPFYEQYIRPVLILFAFTLPVLFYIPPSPVINDVVNSLQTTFWYISIVIYLVMLILYLTRSRHLFLPSSEAIITLSRRYAVLLLIPLLFLFNNMSPYLGIKQGGSLAMFSNLDTRCGKTNHLFIPLQTQIFSRQRLRCGDRSNLEDEVLQTVRNRRNPSKAYLR
jgi:hypothetical protein